MKPTTLFLSALPSLAAAQGFYSTCYSTWSLGYHHSSNFVVARCPSPSGNTTSAIDLQDCLANHEGTLQAGRLGHALSSCRDCAASAGDATVSCQCADSHNDYLDTSLDLDTVITSTDGILGCFDLPGIKVNDDALVVS
ncbi:type II nitroreductase [Pestalotiopsis sp. IQ-011]